jgi:DNA-directed RNA polymerase subunit L
LDLKIEVLNSEKDRFDVLLHGEDLGFANMIVEKLLESKSVSFAAAEYDHPIKGNPIIRVKAKDAKKELAKAVESVEKELSEARAQLAKLK